MASIFTKIINGDLPSYKIAENERCLAFLDVFPLVEGHVLVVPKKEVDRIYDLPAEDYAELFRFGKVIAGAMQEVLTSNRIGLAVVGLEVPHAHLHLVPINSADDINFTRPKIKVDEARMKELQAMIKAALPESI
jgi:histidine triad (HIT) family protein